MVTSTQTDILIIGGGLSGLALAYKLHKSSRSFHLVEARNRLGGRVHAHLFKDKHKETYYDLGPAWFWPGQLRIDNLIDELRLEKFNQYSTGALSYEDNTGYVQRGKGISSMEGSYRLKGSLNALINALAANIPREKISLGLRARKICKDDVIASHLIHRTGQTTKINSNKVVLALPPRIAADSIDFKPKLSLSHLKAMNDIPTWMAGHAKVMAIYEHAFWRDQGLSGDAISRRGPMVEIHDASPPSGGPYALFGFIGVPANHRKGHETALLDAAKAQLIRVFGNAANTPLDLILQDWALEDETATALDHEGLSHHPNYGRPSILKNLWDSRLILGSTETAPTFGGYLEGALEAAECVFDELMSDEK